MRFYDNDTGNEVSIRWTLAFTEASGTIEYYIRTTDPAMNWEHLIRVQADTGYIIYFGIKASLFQYYDGAAWNDIGHGGVVADTWYHISLDFECGAGGYNPRGDGAIAADDWRVYIDNVQYGDYDFILNAANVTYLSWISDFSQNAADIGYSYIDAIGFANFSGYSYSIGDNLTLEAHTNITAYIDEFKIDHGVRETPIAKARIWGQTFEIDDQILVTDTFSDYYHAHPLQNGVIYKDSLNFRDDTLGSVPADTTHGAWVDSSGATCDAFIIDKYNGHSYVLQLEDYNAATQFSIRYGLTTGVSAGSFEWWVATPDPTPPIKMYLYDEGAAAAAGIRILNDLWYYYDSGGWNAMGGTAPVAGKWYRITATVACAWDLVSYYIVDEDGTAIASAEAKTMASSPTTIDTIWFQGDNANSSYLYFIDAIGYTDDANYTLGDNAELDVPLASQTIFEGRIIAQDEEYIQNLELQSLSIETKEVIPGYSATYNPDGYNPNIANYSEEVASEIITDKCNTITATKTDMLYRGSLSFENEADNGNPYGWILYETGGSIYVDADEMPAGQGHKHVLVLNDTNAADYVYARYFFESQTSGTIELWMASDDVTDESSIVFYDIAGNAIFGVELEADVFYYYKAGGWAQLGVAASADNTWYRVRIDFECGSGEYLDLAADTFNIYVYNTAGTVIESDTDVGFFGATTDISFIHIITDSANSNYTLYIDAIGFSWDDDYTIGDNNHIYIEQVKVGTETLDLALDGEYTLERILNSIADLETYEWSSTPDHKFRLDDGTIDCQIDVATGDWEDCAGLDTIDRFNQIITKGGFSGGARQVGTADNTDSQATYGYKIIPRLYALLTSSTTLDTVAAAILTLSENSPKIISLWYRNTTNGKLPVGQTITIPASTVIYNRSNMSYVTTGQWLIIRNQYDAVRSINRLILVDALFYHYAWLLQEELEMLANQT